MGGIGQPTAGGAGGRLLHTDGGARVALPHGRANHGRVAGRAVRRGRAHGNAPLAGSLAASRPGSSLLRRAATDLPNAGTPQRRRTSTLERDAPSHPSGPRRRRRECSVSHGVRVERNRLRFAAGHFATFADELEPIHGHNYDVTVEVEGPLTAESWVIDFSQLKRLTREVCATLDHKFLLQMASRVLTIRDGRHALRGAVQGAAALPPAQGRRGRAADRQLDGRAAGGVHRGAAGRGAAAPHRPAAAGRPGSPASR